MASRIKTFYSRFMDEDHIELKDDIEAEHGFVRHFHIHQFYIHHLIINSPLLMMAASARSWSLLIMSTSAITTERLNS